MPVAFMAMISLLRLSTPNVTSTAISTASGANGVEHAGGEIDEVCAHRGERNAIAQDVADQFEECEDEHQQDEAGQHQDENVDEFADDVLVEDARERRHAVLRADAAAVDRESGSGETRFREARRKLGACRCATRS